MKSNIHTLGEHWGSKRGNVLRSHEWGEKLKHGGTLIDKISSTQANENAEMQRYGIFFKSFKGFFYSTKKFVPDCYSVFYINHNAQLTVSAGKCEVRDYSSLFWDFFLTSDCHQRTEYRNQNQFSLVHIVQWVFMFLWETLLGKLEFLFLFCCVKKKTFFFLNGYCCPLW